MKKDYLCVRTRICVVIPVYVFFCVLELKVFEALAFGV